MTRRAPRPRGRPRRRAPARGAAAVGRVAHDPAGGRRREPAPAPVAVPAGRVGLTGYADTAAAVRTARAAAARYRGSWRGWCRCKSGIDRPVMRPSAAGCRRGPGEPPGHRVHRSAFDRYRGGRLRPRPGRTAAFHRPTTPGDWRPRTLM